MPHIHTEPGQHDLTITAFIIRVDDDKPRILVHMHRKLEILLPVGGHVELTETPWAAALHEIEEESGYELSQLHVLQPKDRIKVMDGVKTHPIPLFLQTHKYSVDEEHYHIDMGFALIAEQAPARQPSEGESMDLRWLTKEELQQLGEGDIPIDVKQIGDFIFTTALLNWEAVSLNNFDA